MPNNNKIKSHKTRVNKDQRTKTSPNEKFNQSKTKGTGSDPMKGNRTGFHPHCDAIVRDSSNDFTWYNKNPQLTKDVANVAFSNMLGLPINFCKETIRDKTLFKQTLPGLMVLHYTPGVGISTDGSSDVNTASRMLYSYVRHANSGSRNYEAPDLMTYILGMSSIYAFYAEMTRVYGLMRMYSHTNRYFTKPIVAALGYDFEDLQKNLASFRAYINVFAAKANTFAVPKSFPIYDRQTWLPTSLFSDSTSDRAQLYAFQAAGYYIWNGTDYSTGSALIYNSFHPFDEPNGEGSITVDRIMAFGNAMLDALLSNEDIGIMSGDILKAWGASECRTLGQISEDYFCPILYDEMILTQINNATICGIFPWEDRPVVDSNYGAVGSNNALRNINKYFDNNIHQEGGNLIYTPYSDGTGTHLAAPVFDAKFSSPTPEYVMEGSRFMAYNAYTPTTLEYTDPGTETTQTITLYSIESAGSEIVNAISFYSLFGGEVDQVALMKSTENVLSDRSSYDKLKYSILQFEWCPHMFESNETTSSVFVYLVTPVYNPVVLSLDTLRKLHNVALLSLLDINALGYKGM